MEETKEVVPVKEVATEATIEEEVGSADEEIDEIFSPIHDSLEVIEDRFTEYYDNPTRESFEAFDMVMKEFTKVTKSLRNSAKKLLPKSEQSKPDEEEPTEQPKHHGRGGMRGHKKIQA